MRRGRNRCLVPVAWADTSSWPSPDLSALTEEARRVHDRRKEAVLKYLAGESFEAIQRETGICPSEVRRFAKRCVSPNDRGGIRGWAGLEFGSRIAFYSRKKPVGDNKATSTRRKQRRA